MKKVSIIVPVYNAAAYLEVCITSILRQTYKNLEIILVNDGSTDESGNICDQYTYIDPRITVIHQENAGPSAARNTGIERATGTYLQFVDADDRIKETTTQQFIHCMEAYDADLVICGYESGNQLLSPTVAGFFTKEVFLNHIGLLYKQIILPSPCNKMYRLEKVKHLGIRFPYSHSFGEDLLFNLSYIENSTSFYVLPNSLYVYEQNPHSLTNSYIDNMFEKQKKLYNDVRMFLEKNDSWTHDNITHLETIFANGVIHAITNLFHQGSPLSTKEQKNQLKIICNHSDVIMNSPYFTSSVQAKLIGTFIRKKAYRLAFLFFKLKEFMRTRLRWMFVLLQQVNKR